MAFNFALPAAAQLGFLRLLNPQQAQQGAMSEEDIKRLYAQMGSGMSAPQQMPAQQQVMPNTAIAEPVGPAARGRVNPLNVIGRVLAPNTFGALDTERTRLQAEADRPQRLAVQQENERIARALGPQALLALRTNSEALGESLGYGYRPQVVSPGSVQAVNGRAVVGAAQQYDQGDERRSFNPLTNEDVLVNRRGPTIAEQNVAERNRIDAIGAGQNTVGNYRIDANGRTVFQAPDEYSLGRGETRFSGGQAVAQGAPPEPTAANLEAQGRLTALDTDVAPTIARMETLLGSGDVITGFGAQARLQAARALAATGNAEARRKVAATEEFMNTSGRLRVGMAKSLGANPSNADIQLLERVTAGDIGQNEDSLLATIRQGRELSDRQRAAIQQQVGQTGGSQAAPQGVSREAAIAEARRRGLIR